MEVEQQLEVMERKLEQLTGKVDAMEQQLRHAQRKLATLDLRLALAQLQRDPIGLL